MNLSRRFVLLISVLVMSVAAIGLTGTRSLGKLDAALQSTIQVDMKRLLTVTDIRRLFRSMVVSEGDYMLEKDAAKRAEILKKLKTQRTDLQAQLLAAEALVPAEEQAQLAALKGAYDRWLPLADEVLAKVEAGEMDSAKAASALHKKDPISWEKVIKGLVEDSEARLKGKEVENAQVYANAVNVVGGVSVGAALVGIAAGVMVFRGIRKNMDEVFELNTNLEGLVAERTRALEARERSMRLVLNSTGEGLLTVDRDGLVLPERSRAADEWFPRPSGDVYLWELLFGEDAVRRDGFQLAFSQLCEDILPFEVAADMVPRRIVRHGQHFELGFREIHEEGAFTKILVIVRDITERVARERAEAESREQQAIIQHLLKDKNGFKLCVDECERILEQLASEDNPVLLKRALHTLKGNAALYGFASVSKLADQLEGQLIEEPMLAPEQVVALQAQWRYRLSKVEEFFQGSNDDVLEVRAQDHAALVERLRAHEDYSDLLRLVESWRWRPTAEFLGRLKAQAAQLGVRLEKQVEVELEHSSIRVPPAALDGFWPTLVHVLRNAMDHGLESPEEREAAGKPAAGRLRLASFVDDQGALVVEIEDDGRGVNADALLASVARKGITLPQSGQPAWIEALFADGVSTREVATDISGRGVGMSAVRAACEAAGGAVLVRTSAGAGTCFSFRFPAVEFVQDGQDEALDLDMELAS